MSLATIPTTALFCLPSYATSKLILTTRSDGLFHFLTNSL
ncbi:hypothetical protein V6Z12_D02G101600 [Gossypium hirsutum]